MKKEITTVVLLLLFLNFKGFAQDNLKDVVTMLMQEVRLGKVKTVNEQPLLKAENADKVLEILKPYSTDSSFKVRDKTFYLFASVGASSKDEKVRKASVEKLVEGCQDKEASVRRNCSISLERFKRNDFNATSKTGIALGIQSRQSPLGHLIQIAAMAGMKENESSFIGLLSEKLSGKDKWAIRLALARLGNLEANQFVLNKIKSAPVNDDMIIEAVPALIFTRQKESFDYLITLINSDKKECTSSNPDSEEPILCGFRIMEYMAPVIEGFPIKTDASGDIQGDYTKALLTVRGWFKKKGNDYTIITDAY